MKGLFVALITCVMLGLCSCQKADEQKVDKETIEAFMTETVEQIAGVYETTGYKKVNAITTVKETKHVLYTRVQAIEDYFDDEGTYLKTVVMDEWAEKAKLLRTTDGNTASTEMKGPLTIHLPDARSEMSIKNLSEQEQAETKAHILEWTSQIDRD